MHFRELLKKLIGTLAGAIFIVRPFLPHGGFLVYPLGGLIREIQRGESVPAIVLIFAVVFDLAHLSLGALLISLGFKEAKKFRKPLLISTLILLGACACLAAYLFGH